MGKFLDEFGLARVWNNIVQYIDSKFSSDEVATVEQVNAAIDSTVGDINTILDAINGEDV